MPLKALGSEEHNRSGWSVAFHKEFAPEFAELSERVRQQIISLGKLLEQLGPQLGRPHVDTLKGSAHANMKELRFRADDGAWRVAFAFDAQRKAILLVAGDKAGVSQDKFYRDLIQTADRRFDRHQKAVAAQKERQ